MALEGCATLFLGLRWVAERTLRSTVLSLFSGGTFRINEAEPEEPRCIYEVKLHVLNQADLFDLKNRKAHYHPGEEMEELLGTASKESDAERAD
jgi:hypothetical protein